MRIRRALSIPLTVVVVLVLFLPRTRAGDLELQTQILFVNMTPDEFSDESSTQCMETIKKSLTDDSTVVRSQGETKTRKSVGVEKGGPHFLRWQATQFTSLLRNHKYDGLRDAPLKNPEWSVLHSDSVLLVDCRPDQHILDILVAFGPSKESAQTLTMSLRGLDLDEPLLVRVAQRAGGYCYNRYWHNEGD